jgi:multiple sugar transport system ATP-binding protein
MAEVRTDKLTKTFRSRKDTCVAVNSVSVHIKEGEFAVFVGPSGSGKTTFLRLVAGLEIADSGRVYIGDEDVTTRHPRERGIAMVFQDYALYPHMTVAENMSFALQNLHFPKAEIEERVMQTARMLQIEMLLDRYPRELSGGQRQRVALGRAIVRKPNVFLFDEPLSNLDAKLRAQMRVELAELHAKLETTAIYVTHDQIEAMTLGHRIFVMNNGVIQQCGTGDEIYSQPENVFVATFLGSPPINLLEAELCAGEDELYLHLEGQRLPLAHKDAYRRFAGKPVLLGVRPEQIRLVSDGMARAGAAILRARVHLVERLGSELLVYFALEGKSLIAKMDSDVSVKVGDLCTLSINMERSHLFDPQTNGRIR